MRCTPLHTAHVSLRARLVDFAGWEMPIQYTGVVDEYHAVRSNAGLFDVSHMGRLRVAGPQAEAFLQHVTTNDVSKLSVLDSHYSMVCNADGGIKDDIFVYRLGREEFLLCVNASNREKIVEWFEHHRRGFAVEVADRSDELSQVALQGPAAPTILTELGLPGVSALKPRGCLEAPLHGMRLLITRTGYTGEVGYELYIPSGQAESVWEALLKVGRSVGLKPAGLGARDLLRLDMAYLLYGNDIDEQTTPLEAGAGWIVALAHKTFLGSEALQRQTKQGLRRVLVAFELLEKAVPRHGFTIVREGHRPEPRVGEVTSGNLSPLLQKGIGLGYVPPELAAVGTSLMVDVRGRRVPALVVKPPFYKRRGRLSG